MNIDTEAVTELTNKLLDKEAEILRLRSVFSNNADKIETLIGYLDYLLKVRAWPNDADEIAAVVAEAKEWVEELRAS